MLLIVKKKKIQLTVNGGEKTVQFTILKRNLSTQTIVIEKKKKREKRKKLLTFLKIKNINYILHYTSNFSGKLKIGKYNSVIELNFRVFLTRYTKNTKNQFIELS